MPRKRKPVNFPIIVFGHNSTAPGGNFGAEIEPEPARRDLGIYDSVEQRERFEQTTNVQPAAPSLTKALQDRARQNYRSNGIRNELRKLKKDKKQL